MCRKGAWTELTAMVTAGNGSQSRLHGFFYYIRKLLFNNFEIRENSCLLVKSYKNIRMNFLYDLWNISENDATII